MMDQTPEPDTPEVLATSQVKAASELLGRAFEHDPLMLYLVPDARRRVGLLPAFFRIVLRYCLRYGIVYAAPDLAGVACCLPPGQTSPTLTRLTQIGLRGLPPRLGLAGLRRFLRVSRYTDQAHAQATPGAHWYLWVLGVEPQAQGQGVGSQLLHTLLQQAEARRVPCYLETENPRNVPFYQHHGFRLVSETIVEATTLHIYALVWEPAPSDASRA
jgi:ribosomal protein S18 acetylase RimI-like enzyme